MSIAYILRKFQGPTLPGQETTSRSSKQFDNLRGSLDLPLLCQAYKAIHPKCSNCDACDSVGCLRATFFWQVSSNKFHLHRCLALRLVGLEVGLQQGALGVVLLNELQLVEIQGVRVQLTHVQVP